jgi:shikimate kinase
MLIFIIGFMGCGKSYLGKIWAAENNLHFCDVDTIIEQEEGQSIAAIFQTNGEDYFRQKEKEVLQKMGKLQNTIVACGGGTPCFYGNITWMKNVGTVVFLNETVEKILLNIAHDKQVRPLLLNMSEPEKNIFVQNKLAERLPIYKQSDIILSTEQLHKDAFKLVKYFIENNLKNA